MSIPLNVLNTLHSFAQNNHLVPKDLSWIVDPSNAQQLVHRNQFDTKCLMQTSILTRPRRHEMRWMPCINPLLFFLSYIIEEKLDSPSMVISLGISRIHLLHSEITHDRLESILTNDVCCICLEAVERQPSEQISQNPQHLMDIWKAETQFDSAVTSEIEPHNQCPQCSIITCSECTKQRKKMVYDELDKTGGSEMKRIIAENLKCPQCSYITEINVASRFLNWARNSDISKSRIIEILKDMLSE